MVLEWKGKGFARLRVTRPGRRPFQAGPGRKGDDDERRRRDSSRRFGRPHGRVEKSKSTFGDDEATDLFGRGSFRGWMEENGASGVDLSRAWPEPTSAGGSRLGSVERAGGKAQ